MFQHFSGPRRSSHFGTAPDSKGVRRTNSNCSNSYRACRKFVQLSIKFVLFAHSVNDFLFFMEFQKQENGEVSCDCLNVVAFLEFGGVSTYVSFERKAEGVVFLFAFSDSFAAPPKKEVVHCSLFSAPSGSLPTLAGTFSELSPSPGVTQCEKKA